MELPGDLRERVIELACTGLPNEVCGYVAGKRGEQAVALEVHAIANALASPVAFALDGQEMIDAEVRIDTSGLEIVGVYHSHPTGSAAPSARDCKDAAIYDPGGHFVHLIISLRERTPTLRAWTYKGNVPVEVALTDGVVK